MSGRVTGRPRILFLINSLAGGGAERVLVSLLDLSADMRDEYDFSLALLDDEKREYAVPDWLTVHQCEAGQSLVRSIRELDRLVRRERPALILSFLTRANVAAVVAARRHGLRAIISERVMTSSHLAHGLSGFVARALVRLSYPRADHVIAVSQGIAADLADNYAVPPDRISVISNPVDITRIEREALAEPAIALPERFMIAVSRLTSTKNVMLVVEALAQARIDLPLVVLGQGPERDAILRRAGELGVADRLHLAGFCANPYAIMRRAEFFVSGSNAEGFPNGLVEALALGLPVVATNCASGPSEILADVPRESVNGLTRAPYGILVPTNDASLLAQAMDDMAQPETQAHYAALARSRAAFYSPEKARAAYWDVIGSMVPKG